VWGVAVAVLVVLPEAEVAGPLGLPAHGLQHEGRVGVLVALDLLWCGPDAELLLLLVMVALVLQGPTACRKVG
jgi:hypothetical protein